MLRVWDGNSVLIENGLTVRYIGVETPGAGMFNRPLEPFGRQAAERNVALVEGKTVEIEQDVNDVDSNGFLLRYVYVDDQMVNELLLREGLGKLSPATADRKYRAQLEAAQDEARSGPLNVWTVVSPTPRPTAVPTRTPSPGPETLTPQATLVVATLLPPSTSTSTAVATVSRTPTIGQPLPPPTLTPRRQDD